MAKIRGALTRDQFGMLGMQGHFYSVEADGIVRKISVMRSDGFRRNASFWVNNYCHAFVNYFHAYAYSLKMKEKHNSD